MATTKLSKKLSANLKLVEQSLHNTDDLIIREFKLTFKEGYIASGALLYLDGLVDGNEVQRSILRPLLVDARRFSGPTDPKLLDYLVNSLLTSDELSETQSFKELLLSILSGETVLLMDGIDRSVNINTKGFETRAIDSPQSEAVIRGPRDSFVESIAQNLMLVRRRLKDPRLVVKRLKLGTRGNTDVVVTYIDGITDPKLIQEVDKRLKAIDVDVILDSGYIEQLIEDSWWSPFNTVQDTERPDEVAAGLMEGRVAILMDNSPFALLVPATFISQLHSPEDYYLRWPLVNVIRIIRFTAVLVAMLTPGLYIALVAFHPEMIPTQLALSIAATREGIPFPAFVEALLMELSLELLREAGLRLPGPIGQTIGIVGGLIIGDAAVRANLVSPIMVIVVALTAIAGFVIPTYTFGLGIRTLRFFLLISASFFGLYGLTVGALVILGHLCSLDSFGVSYMSPFAPIRLADWKDTILRAPLHRLNRRPIFMNTKDTKRQPKKSKKTKRRLK